jgi:hypothetical protein
VGYVPKNDIFYVSLDLEEDERIGGVNNSKRTPRTAKLMTPYLPFTEQERDELYSKVWGKLYSKRFVQFATS